MECACMKKIEINIKAKCPHLMAVIKVQFDTGRINDCSEEAKVLLRKLYQEIVALHKQEGISVAVKQVEKTNLGEIRAKAIATFKLFYKSYDFGDYSVSTKDTQITERQAELVFDEVQLRKYFESTEWYAKDKILSKYCSTDIQNRLNQKEVKLKESFPDEWELEYYTGLKSQKARSGYIKHIIALGYVKKNTGSGILCYVKNQNT